MQPFLVCIHDAAPLYFRETRVIVRDLAPLLGRRLSFAVVPDWHGEWPLEAHPDYCSLVRENSEELLLHGYFHRRRRGWGPTTLLADACDEMNGLDPEETRRTLERGQRVLTECFGQSARGFLAPGWQPGNVSRSSITAHQQSGVGTTAACAHPPPAHYPGDGNALGLEHIVGFFSIESWTGRSVPLATWTWDCGRWGWLGHIGHGIGWLLQALDHGVPALAIHPGDLERGFWPTTLRLIQELLDRGYEPSTSAGLLETEC